MWIDTHTLSNAAFNIRPFLAGAFHAPPNAHNTFLFSFTEIVYQTHLISPMSGRVLDTPALMSVMQTAEGWKLLDFLNYVASLQTASAALKWMNSPALTQAARRASRLPTPPRKNRT